MVHKGGKTIKVYYNSACPLCNAGIENQKSKIPDCHIDWNDVHTQSGVHNEVSPNLELVRKKLHVMDEKGNIKVGIEAFETIWRHSSNEHWKAKIVSLPIVKQISIFLYDMFAEILYRWNRWKQHW
ncbi:thiol-disulfide oxidoreductase DCC family protein [Nitrosococcus watsonii]|uniref:Putative thiol-disulfide oxidoreductase DCC n=1 Tax=Nitrosococcus watsoni (strain C-113) TaxID=105559 RepID=D8K6R4_NITWC|nr:DUF393 domain-containing protein [Nitrosococcus watsonii]ADJ28591.1 putative thiol-disulfide oxidoreductase DCC [Nitrosococcus watsonii C-113]